MAFSSLAVESMSCSVSISARSSSTPSAAGPFESSLTCRRSSSMILCFSSVMLSIWMAFSSLALESMSCSV